MIFRGSCLLSTFAVLVLVQANTSHATSFSDDFNDGNDSGWTRYDPFAPILNVPAYADFSFPDGNSLRISSPVSPSPSQLGAARAANIRNDIVQTDFYLTVDLVGWDNNLNQLFGLVARGQNVGLGSTTGYLFAYSAREFDSQGRLELNRIDGESPIRLQTMVLTLDPAHDYRLVFQGVGDVFDGYVYDLTVPQGIVAHLTASDADFTNGSPGVFIADASAGEDHAADATFDNFYAAEAVPEPAALLLMLSSALCVMAWRRFGRGYLTPKTSIGET